MITPDFDSLKRTNRLLKGKNDKKITLFLLNNETFRQIINLDLLKQRPVKTNIQILNLI